MTPEEASRLAVRATVTDIETWATEAARVCQDGEIVVRYVELADMFRELRSMAKDPD